MTSMDPADQSLLAHLGSVAAEVDPPPPLLFELGRAAFGMHGIDADLLRLVDDAAGDLAGVRAVTSGPRLLTFEGNGLTVDLQLTVDTGRVRIVGQVMPLPKGRGRVRVETADGSVTVAPVDDVGGFTVAGLSEALLRVRVEIIGQAAVNTTWISP